jgi:adenylate cyclase
MNLKILLLFSSFLTIYATVIGQQTTAKDTAFINKLLQESKSLIKDDTAKAIRLARQAKELSTKIRFHQGEAYAFKNLGLVYYMQGKYVETLDYWNQSLKIFEDLKDDVGTSNLLNNIAAIYFDQGVDDKALEYSLKSLKLAEKTKDNLRILSALATIGAIYHNKKDPVAVKYLLRALPLCEATGNNDSYVIIAGNLGEVYFDNNEDAKALEFYKKAINADTSSSTSAFSFNGIGKIYLRKNQFKEALSSHEKALQISQKVDDKLQIIRSLRGKGDVYARLKDFSVALQYYKQATTIAEGLKANVELKDLYSSTSLLFSDRGDYQSAYTYQKKYADIKDTLYNVETAKKLGQLQFDFDISTKEAEIKLLTNEKSLREAEIKTARQARTALTAGLVLILIIAFIIYRNYLNKAKINKVLDKQKNEIEHLLLNILPVEIAAELQATGFAKSRHINNVSVLFTDFKGFTSIAEKLSPSTLVKELNECFIAFDNIIERHKLEKIKTIGDSYMCAGNLPSSDPDHLYNMVKAALEIQEFLHKTNKIRVESGFEPWEARIGIHTGPVVAGVVGKKKYAYDIWGSTVNIASRMESNGYPGRINISSSTYEAIKEYFECSYRGKIKAKNAGEIDMYFVEHELIKTVSQN